MAVKGTALAAVAVGSVSVYAGIKGISIPQAIQAIVQGQSPATLAQSNPITLPSAAPSSPSSPSDTSPSSPTPPGDKAPGDLSGNPAGNNSSSSGNGGDPGFTLPPIVAAPPGTSGAPGLTGAPPWAR